MSNPLTHGSIQSLMHASSASANTSLTPGCIVQLLSLTPQNQGRHKVEISDGQTIAMGILSSQHSPLITQGQIAMFTCIKILDCLVSNQQVVVIVKSEVVAQYPSKIGNPIPFSVAAAAADSHHQHVQQNQHSTPLPPLPTPSFMQQQQQQPTYQQQRFQAPRPQSQQQPQQALQSNVPAPLQQQMQQATIHQHLPPMPGAANFSSSTSYMQGVGASKGQTSISTFHPIRALTTYLDKFVIKARVTSKGDVKMWDKGPNNAGKLFSVDLMDSDGDEIRATFFKDAVDHFYDRIEVGKVYSFSNGRVKAANQKFSTIKNEYEINFGGEADVVEVADDGNIGHVSLKPKAIATIEQIGINDIIDVLGICMSASNVQEFQSKAGKSFKKADIELLDNSNTQIRVSLWGDKAEEIIPQLQQNQHVMVGIKGVKVSDFGGRTLSTLASSTIMLEPGIQEAQAIRQWFTTGQGGNPRSISQEGGAGSGKGPKPIESRITFAAIRDMGIGAGNPNGEIVDVKGTIQLIKKDQMWYPACPEPGVNKKVVKNMTDNRWYCEATSRSYDRPDYRYIASITAADHTGLNWLSVFNEAGQKMFRCDANELQAAKEANDPMFDRIVDSVKFQQGIFTLKVKEESFQDGMKQRSNVLSFRPIDYVEESTSLIRLIKSYSQQ